MIRASSTAKDAAIYLPSGRMADGPFASHVTSAIDSLSPETLAEVEDPNKGDEEIPRPPMQRKRVPTKTMAASTLLLVVLIDNTFGLTLLARYLFLNTEISGAEIIRRIMPGASSSPEYACFYRLMKAQALRVVTPARRDVALQTL